MRKIIILILCVVNVANAQNDALQLDSCFKMAKRNYPLIKQQNLISELEKNALNAENKNWLPKISFNSKATFQSEVIAFGGKTFPKDNYMTALDVEQTLFDGGQIKQQKEINKLNSKNQQLNNEIELYKLIDRITQLYSSILMSRENLKVLELYKTDIIGKKTILVEAVKNGLVLQSNLEELEAEVLKSEQSIVEVKDNLVALYVTLGMYIGKNVTDATSFETNVNSASTSETINRPELKYFETQKSIIEARHKLNNQFALPKITLNAQGAYGRPGPNFLNQNLRFFAQGGINLRWNVGTLYTLNNEFQNYTINKKMVDVQKEVFEFNIKVALASQKAQIIALQEIIEKDKLIVQKRHNVTLTASSQLENGTITITDYLIQLDAEVQASLNQKMHEIKLLNAITNFNSTKGNNNF